MGHFEVGPYKCQLIKMPRIFLFFDELKSNSSQILKLRVASSVLGDIEFLKLIMIFLISIDKFLYVYSADLCAFGALMGYFLIFWWFYGTKSTQ